MAKRNLTHNALMGPSITMPLDAWLFGEPDDLTIGELVRREVHDLMLHNFLATVFSGAAEHPDDALADVLPTQLDSARTTLGVDPDAITVGEVREMIEPSYVSEGHTCCTRGCRGHRGPLERVDSEAA